MAGLQVVCEVHFQGGESLGHPPENIGNLDHLILIIIIIILQYISVGSHCQGIII